MIAGTMIPSGPDGLGTKSAEGAIIRVRFTHDAMVDMIIANPAVSNRQLASAFGYSENWISRLLCSDAFQARLAARKADLVDPCLEQTIENRLQGLMVMSTEILAEKLEATRGADLALKVAELSTKALGYGARQDKAPVQNNFVVMMPGKIDSAEAWANQARPSFGAAPAQVVDMVTVPSSPTEPDA